jgi:hypothetical protein
MPVAVARSREVARNRALGFRSRAVGDRSPGVADHSRAAVGHTPAVGHSPEAENRARGSRAEADSPWA